MIPDSLNKLVESFKLLPGIGEKTAERLAFSILEMDEDNVSLFSNSLINVKNNIRKCKKCNNLTEEDYCFICNDKDRNNKVLCVVEDAKNLFLFEKAKVYDGLYHVLDGLISPLEGKDPDDINISSLINRINNNSFEEIILAFKPSIEGETTALYIKRILEDKNIRVTRIASGIPMGADIEYIDSITLERALIDRKSIE